MCVLKQLHLELEEHATASIRFRAKRSSSASWTIRTSRRCSTPAFRAAASTWSWSSSPVRRSTTSQRGSDKEKNPMPPSIAIAIILRVLDGLEHAHEIVGEDGEHMRLVHRDLTPRNIMVGYDGDGADHRLRSRLARRWRTTTSAPARACCSERSATWPRSRRSRSTSMRAAISTRSASCLYELLTDRPLLPPGPPTETIRRIVREAPPKLRSVKPNLPEELERVLDRAMAKGPDGRYQSAREFHDELRRCWLELPSQEELGAFVRGLFSARGEARRAGCSTPRRASTPITATSSRTRSRIASTSSSA